MGKFEQIMRSIEELPQAERVRLTEWLVEFEERRFDDRIESDAKAGRLDASIAETKAEHDAGDREEF